MELILHLAYDSSWQQSMKTPSCPWQRRVGLLHWPPNTAMPLPPTNDWIPPANSRKCCSCLPSGTQSFLLVLKEFNVQNEILAADELHSYQTTLTLRFELKMLFLAVSAWVFNISVLNYASMLSDSVLLPSLFGEKIILKERKFAQPVKTTALVVLRRHVALMKTLSTGPTFPFQ